MKDIQRIIKNHKFVYLWTSQILSQLAINIMNFVLLIRIIAVTDSSIAASFLWIAYALPALFIGPIAAAAVDMIERRKVLMFTNLFQSLTIFLYALTHDQQFFILFVVVFIYSFLNQFYVPAEQASVPVVVPKKDLPITNSLFFVTQQSSVIVGFGIGGVLLSLLGFTNSLFLCSAFLFVAFLSVALLPEIKVKSGIPMSLERAAIEFFRRISEGYHFIKGNNKILFPFILLMSMQIGLVVAIINVPLLAREILKIGILSSGAGIVVPTGLGALTGAFIVSRLLKKGIRKRLVIEYSLMFLGISLTSIAIFLSQLPSNLSITLGVIMFFAIGAGFLGVVIPAQTYLQEVTPGGLRGRVFGNFWFLVTAATVVPIIFSATITEILGTRYLILLVAVLCFVAFYIAKTRWEKFLTK